jgi:hypothetical protein
MIEILKTTDPVRLNYIQAMLESAGLNPLLVEASALSGRAREPSPGARRRGRAGQASHRRDRRPDVERPRP